MATDRAMFRALVRRELSFFLRLGFREIGGDGVFLHNWHIEAMIHVLERVRMREIRRLIITLPPRHLKSIVVSTCWPAWLLGLNPALRIITASYGQEVAEKFSRDSLRIIDSRFFRAAFPRFSLTRRSSGDFETAEGGGRLSTSLNGPITGRGADLIIIDDPIKGADIRSDVARAAAIEWFTSVLMSRLNDQQTGAIVLVMQRLHQSDLAGELLERGGWHELRLPAIAPEEMLVQLGRGRVHRRAEGAVLHPARQTRETLEDLRTSMGSTAFAAQFLQDPVPPEGNIVKAEWLLEHDPTLLDCADGRIVQSWDTATKTGEQHDWSVCITCLVRRRRVFVLDVWRRKVEFAELWKAVQRLARTWNAKALLIEDTGNGSALLQRLRYEPPSGVPSPIARRPKLDKRSRLDAASSMIEAGDLSLPFDTSWLAQFKSELLGFPSARHDDQVDALSQLLNWVDQRESDRDCRIGAPIYVRADGTPSRNIWCEH